MKTYKIEFVQLDLIEFNQFKSECDEDDDYDQNDDFGIIMIIAMSVLDMAMIITSMKKLVNGKALAKHVCIIH